MNSAKTVSATFDPVIAPPSEIGDVHWEDLSGNRIDLTTVSEGTTAKLVAKTSFPEGTTINFDLNEEDNGEGLDFNDDDVGVFSSVTDSAGTAIYSYTFSCTSPTDCDNLGGGIEEFDDNLEMSFIATEPASGKNNQSKILNINLTVTPGQRVPAIDLIPPTPLSKSDGTYTLLTATFNASVVASNAGVDSCWYDLVGGVNVNGKAMQKQTRETLDKAYCFDSIVLVDQQEYNLTVYAKDINNNINSTERTFFVDTSQVCTNQCNLGDWQCASAKSNQTCVLNTVTGCYEWGAPNECGVGEICGAGGQCITPNPTASWRDMNGEVIYQSFVENYVDLQISGFPGDSDVNLIVTDDDVLVDEIIRDDIVIRTQSNGEGGYIWKITRADMDKATDTLGDEWSDSKAEFYF